MPRKPQAIVLDTWAVLAYLQEEPSGRKVAEIIALAHEDQTPLLMSVLNAGKVWYIMARKTSDSEADQSISDLRELGIEFVDCDWKLTREAAALKSKHRISYADAHAATLAKLRKAELVTGDKEFAALAGDIKIHWL